MLFWSVCFQHLLRIFSQNSLTPVLYQSSWQRYSCPSPSKQRKEETPEKLCSRDHHLITGVCLHTWLRSHYYFIPSSPGFRKRKRTIGEIRVNWKCLCLSKLTLDLRKMKLQEFQTQEDRIQPLLGNNELLGKRLVSCSLEFN